MEKGDCAALAVHEHRSAIGVQCVEIFNCGGIAHTPHRFPREERGTLAVERISLCTPEVDIAVLADGDSAENEPCAGSSGKIVEIMECPGAIVGDGNDRSCRAAVG